MANNNLPAKYAPLFTTSLAQSIGNGNNETITLTTTARLPQGERVTLTIDRLSNNGVVTLEKRECITGIVSGTNLIDYTRGVDDTQPQAHNAGALVELNLTAYDWNRSVDLLKNLLNFENLISLDDKNTIKLGSDQKLFANSASTNHEFKEIVITGGAGVLSTEENNIAYINHQLDSNKSANININANVGDYFRLHLSNTHETNEITITFSSTNTADTLKLIGGETSNSLKLEAKKSADIYFDKFDKKITGHVEAGE